MGVPSLQLSLVRDSATHLRGFSPRESWFPEPLGPVWEMRMIASFRATVCNAYAPTPPYHHVQLCVLLHAVLQRRPEMGIAFIQLLLRDSEKMDSEKQNNLSKITMLVLLLSQHTPVSFVRAEAP